MPYLRKVVPEKFWKGLESPNAKTVGGLIALLQELPADLRLDLSYGVSVVNIKSPNPAASLDPGW